MSNTLTTSVMDVGVNALANTSVAQRRAAMAKEGKAVEWRRE